MSPGAPLLTKTATADTFNYTFALDSVNSSGTSISANVFNYSGSLVNAGSYANTRFLSFYGGNDNNGTGAIALDNFGTSPIPEPSAFAVLAGFGALGLAATRRRRR